MVDNIQRTVSIRCKTEVSLPSVVEDTLTWNELRVSKRDPTERVAQNAANNVSVLVNESKAVVTVKYGKSD